MKFVPLIFSAVILSILLLNLPRISAQEVERDPNKVLPLEGIWKFKLDPFETGINSNGVQLLPQLTETITLPGSTDQAGKGIKTHDMTSIRLTRAFEYKGIAWYEKEIFVPLEWKDKAVELFLERPHWETQVWVNGKPAGKKESLSVPHLYDVDSLIQPGKKNTVRIRVNNDKIYDLEYAHAISAETQTNWNGIAGEIRLQAFDKVFLKDIQVYPDIPAKKAKIRMEIANGTQSDVQGSLTFANKVINSDNPISLPLTHLDFSGGDSLIFVETELDLGPDLQLWDEFNPVLYELTVQLDAKGQGTFLKDQRSVTYGLRELGIQGTQFVFNGRPTFIRGTVNCAEFPLTGYPPTDIEEWRRIFNICIDYGLNMMRFHTWCPPEAAFQAADELGFYLQVENPDWRFTVGKDAEVNRFLKEEADRILKTYGNHPSFIMFCEGNEMVGPQVKEFLSEQVSNWKESDPRRLYTGSAAYPMIPENEFHVLYGARPHRWKEGLTSRFNVRPLDTEYDYSDYVVKNDVPMITHEIGQWCVYPNFNEISKYTGVLKPYNYELFRELLRDRKMLDQAEAFTQASGKFSVIMKKEEVESYLRTPEFGGYHMLQLNDFPGQGTAPVGVVDIFWDPKSYVTAAEFRRFQSPRVPLLRTKSFTWTNDQVFRATAQFANFGDSPMEETAVHWSLRYLDGKVYAEGEFAKQTIPVGSPIPLGELSIPLTDIDQAVNLYLIVGVPGTSISNQWDIWVYPAHLPEVSTKEILITDQLDDKTKRHLEKGGKVLLMADTANINSDADPVFSGISWNTVWSGMPPNLLGILCDPSTPLLGNFPTQFHSNWQWWDIVAHSKPMVLDHLPFGFKPLVQMVPDWNNPRKIGLVFEAKVGKGNLLVTSVDLKNKMEERPVARQFLYSLEKYAMSPDFSPEDEVSIKMIEQIFKND